MARTTQLYMDDACLQVWQTCQGGGGRGGEGRVGREGWGVLAFHMSKVSPYFVTLAWKIK